MGLVFSDPVTLGSVRKMHTTAAHRAPQRASRRREGCLSRTPTYLERHLSPRKHSHAPSFDSPVSVAIVVVVVVVALVIEQSEYAAVASASRSGTCVCMHTRLSAHQQRRRKVPRNLGRFTTACAMMCLTDPVACRYRTNTSRSRIVVRQAYFPLRAFAY